MGNDDFANHLWNKVSTFKRFITRTPLEKRRLVSLFSISWRPKHNGAQYVMIKLIISFE